MEKYVLDPIGLLENDDSDSCLATVGETKESFFAPANDRCVVLHCFETGKPERCQKPIERNARKLSCLKGQYELDQTAFTSPKPDKNFDNTYVCYSHYMLFNDNHRAKTSGEQPLSISRQPPSGSEQSGTTSTLVKF